MPTPSRKPSRPKASKKAKIVHVIPGTAGPVGGVLYDDGRVFLFTYTKAPNPYDGQNPGGEGIWYEMIYPDLTAFDQRDRPEKAYRSNTLTTKLQKMDKVNSLEEAQKHFLNNDAEGQVPSVVCVKDGEEKEVASLAEAEAFYAPAANEEGSESGKTAAAPEETGAAKPEEGEDAGE